MKLKEFGRYEEIPIEDVQGFKKFIDECWRKRYSFYDDADIYGNEYFNKQQFMNFDGNRIRAKNYVGFISYQGMEITIYPKIFNDEIQQDHLEKYFMQNLLYWLNRSKRIKFPILDTDMDLNKMDSFLEILIYVFSKYTYNLIYNKPYNCYEEVEEETSFMKGRLNVNKYLKENISTGRWDKFSSIYEPYIYNNKFNKIIKFVSSRLKNITNNKEAKSYLDKINFILNEVDDVYCNEYSCNEVKLNRLQKEYNFVLLVCEMFLKNTSISKSNSNDKIDFCFLIPMEVLFEEFIYNFIKEKFSDNYKEITAQKSNLYLAEVIVDDNKPQRVFNLKQDIFMKDHNDEILIADTKYKILNKNEDLKYGVSQSDMYQMCSYALRGGYTNFILIYPEVEAFDKEIRYEINNGFGGEKIIIDILNVPFALDYEMLKCDFCGEWEANDNRLYNELNRKI